MKISILTPDFSNNCYGRAWLLANLLSDEFDIEIIGPDFGRGLWKPMAEVSQFEKKIVPLRADGSPDIRKHLECIGGDVIYASKPLFNSFGVGLLKSIPKRKPLVLDIDDYEPGFGGSFYRSLTWPKKIIDCMRSLSNFQTYYYTLLLDKLTFISRKITVSGPVLQKRYGGVVVWHGRDEKVFDPGKYDREKIRLRHLPQVSRDDFIIGFIGTPRKHKGLEDLLSAFKALSSKKTKLMIVGDLKDGYSESDLAFLLHNYNSGQIVNLGVQPFSQLPELLMIPDVIVIPQKNQRAANGQVPAKLFDAMVMGKPIIATKVPEMRGILNGCGWLVEPGNPRELNQCLQYVINQPQERRERGRSARLKFIQEYNWRKLKNEISPIFKDLK